MKFGLLFLIALFLFGNPENQIVLIDDFISPEWAQKLIEYYDSQKKDLNSYTDNQLTFSPSTNPEIRAILSKIQAKILDTMREHYSLSDKVYNVDHCAVYARIGGNFCPYHADNTYFKCPIHGADQNRLRIICPGNCPGSQYFPNHTPWREYTALLYLNDSFTGGEIAFEDGPANKIYRKIIPIRARLLVLTPNGPNFYHEVFQIRNGKRYSLHFWMTSDRNHFMNFFSNLKK